MPSAKDVMELEINAAQTQFAANQDQLAVFAALLDSDRWMIFNNQKTSIMHWDFVRGTKYCSELY